MEGRQSALRVPISRLVVAALVAPTAHILPLTLLACADARRGSTAPALAPSSALEASQDASGERLEVRKGGPGARPGSLVLTFSRPVDPAQVVVGETVLAFVDADANPGGVFLPQSGRATLDPTGRVLTFQAEPAPAEGHELRLLLAGTLSAAGAPALRLEPGSGSRAISFPREAPQAVFELRATPCAAAAAAGAGDDHADGPAGATPLSPGVSARGRIDVAGDRDWFRLRLRAGDEVTVRTVTSGDTTLAVYAPDATTLLASNDDDPQGGLASRVELRAANAGEYLVEVAGYGTRTPEYGLEATLTGAAPAPAGDDHAGDAAGASPLAVGGDAVGRIELAGDQDWFALALQAGQVVELATVTTADTTLAAYAPDGATLLGQNDDDPQGGRHSRLRLAAGAAGTYFAAVAGYGSTTPTYRLEARAVATSGESPPDPDRFRIASGTDPWVIDFQLRQDDWQADLRAHGLRAGDASTDALAEARVIDAVLSWTSRMYARSPDGGGAPSGLRISFTRNRPAGTAGRQFSREAVGGRHRDGAGTLGVSWLDYGNQRKEDNATAGELGIFSASIFGRASTLSPALGAADRRYLDGSYRLGDGSASDDRRFQRVRDVIADWGHALAVVVAHEVGHSVGLDHDETDADSIMHPTLSRWVLSDPATSFSAGSTAELERTLGRHPAP